MGRQAVEHLDFEALEMAARQRVLQLAARAIEQRLNADASDEAGSRLPCRCGSRAQFMGRRSKTFRSVLGPLQLQRAYFYCFTCSHGFFPRDRHLGMEDTSLSPAVTRMIGTVGALVSFEEGSELLQELAGVSIDAKQVERTAEALGREIATDEQQHSEPVDTLPLPQTLYLGIDGTGIPMRAEELTGVPGKSEGGAKTREGKLCTVWSAESCDDEGIPIRDEGSVSYSAAIESASAPDTAKQPSAFARRVWRESQRRRFTQAVRRVALGDGACWIWNVIEELFPGIPQIVDRFHAKQHLSDLGKALYSDQRASQWASEQHEKLDKGKLRAIIAAIRPHVPSCDEARRCLHYFWANRKRMRYPRFHAQGLCTSTGVVESACKVVVGTRLKRSGMHWTVLGANAIIALRCAKLSGRFQDFWERRSERRAA